VSRFLRVSLALVLAFLALPTVVGRAQRVLPIDRLPSNTYAVMIWHGQTAIAKGASTNNLVRLWNDPDFTSVRQIFSQALAGSGPDAASNKGLSKADQDAMLDAMANPGIVGAAGAVDLGAIFDEAKTGVKSKDSDVFIIWDGAGKEAQWKRIDALAQNPSKPATITNVKLKGIDVRVSETDTRMSYTGTVGPWRVEAGRQALFEDLVGRLQAATAPSTSLIQSALYTESQRFRADNTLAEFLVKMPDTKTIKSTPGEAFNVAAFMQGLRMDRVRGFVGSIGLAGSGTQMRGALVGDTTPGGIFDMFGASTTTFGTLPAAPVGYSYNASKIDLGAFYRTVRAALKGAMPPDQFGNLEMMEGMVAAEMQMSLADLLGSIEEVATITPADAVSSDFQRVMFALRLKKTSDFIALFKKSLGEMISAESTEGGTTYLTLTSPIGALHVAAGPQLLVVAPTRELARGAMTRAAAATPQPGSLAADAGFQKGRALYPPALTSLAYSDMTKIPWQSFLGELTSAMPDSAKGDPTRERLAGDLVRLLPPLMAKYLKSSSSAGWKTPGGVFFEGRID
jgi:hypothetical protein